MLVKKHTSEEVPMQTIVVIKVSQLKKEFYVPSPWIQQCSSGQSSRFPVWTYNISQTSGF